MEQSAKTYDHVIIIDDSSEDIEHLKKSLISINYANHISCFVNPKIASKYIKNCRKFPEIIFLNMPEMEGLEFIGSFIKGFNHLIKFIITSSSFNIMDLQKSSNCPNIIRILPKPVKTADLKYWKELS